LSLPVHLLLQIAVSPLLVPEIREKNV